MNDPEARAASDLGSDSSSATMAARRGWQQVKRWVLMDADRWLVTVGLLGLVCLGLLAATTLGLGPLSVAIRQTDPVETLFQAMTTGIITGVTLVVSINQLVLSQELGPIGDQRSRLSGAMEYRTDAESHLDEPVSPAEPTRFLRSLLASIHDSGERLATAATAVDGESLAHDLDQFATDLTAASAAVRAELEGSEFGTFELVSGALDFDYSAKLYAGRRLQAAYESELSDEVADTLDEVLTLLVLFGPAREHFKTLYFQWELINLSRSILYAAVPALTTSVAMILLFNDPSPIAGTTLGIDTVFLLVLAGTLVTISPFLLLVSYMLRIATVAQNTLAIGPFVLQDTDHASIEEDR